MTQLGTWNIDSLERQQAFLSELKEYIGLHDIESLIRAIDKEEADVKAVIAQRYEQDRERREFVRERAERMQKAIDEVLDSKQPIV